MKCLIVLPCFNEEENVKSLVCSIDQVLKPHVAYEIIAVNDGSFDRTGEVLKILSADYPIRICEHTSNMGLGSALRTGLLAAADESNCDDFVVIMDSDNTHNPKHVLDMLLAAKDADVVVGSRYVRGGMQMNVPIHRVVLSKGINILVGRLFLLGVRDATSGFRCFRAKLVKQLRDTFKSSIIESRGFVASLELLLKAVRIGGAVKEIPILLDYGKKGGASKMRLVSTVYAYLILILKYRRPNDLKRPD